MFLTLKNKISNFFQTNAAAIYWAIWFCILAFWIWSAPLKWFYQDSAYLFFRLLNNEPLFYDRFVNGISLFPAFVAAKLNAPISWVLHCLNLGFISFCTLIFWHKLNKKQPVFLLVLMVLLLSSEHYFIGFSEVIMSSFGFVCLLIQLQHKPNWSIALFGFITLNAHPVGMIYLAAVIYLCLFNLNKKALVWLCIPIILSFAMRFWLPINNYDKGLMSELFNANNWKNVFSNYAWQFYTSNFTLLFWGPVCLLLFSLPALIKQKLWRTFLLDSSLIFALFLIFVTVYIKGDSNLMMQKFIFPFSLITCGILYLHFAQYWLKTNNWVLVLLLIISLSITFNASSFFIERNKALNNLIKTCNNNQISKIITTDKIVNGYTFGNTWALPYESLLWSNYANTKSTSITLDTAQLKSNQFAEAVFNLPGKIYTLNTHYFKLDSQSNYKRFSLQ